MYALAADVGGTKTKIRLTGYDDGRPVVICEKLYSSQYYQHFDSILDNFFSNIDSLANNNIHACLAVAGPVFSDCAIITNIAWTLNRQDLQRKYKLGSLTIVNDFTAIGYSIARLNQTDYLTIQQGQERTLSTQAVFGAGTGLGLCIVSQAAGQTVVISSEYGNTDFAPADDFSIKLLMDLKKTNNRIFHEDILSGKGLENIYTFLCKDKHHERPANGTECNDLAARISASALTGNDPVAIQAMKHFTRIYAHTARNIALTALSVGGLYIAGGIAPKILEHINREVFTRIFNDNKKMHHVLKEIPVKIILNTDAGLIGAETIAVSNYSHSESA